MAKRPGSGPPKEEDKKPITKEGFSKAIRIFSFIKPYRLYFIVGMVFLALSSLTVMVFPYVTGKLVDSAIGTQQQYDRNTIALGLIGILVVQALFSFGRVALFAFVSERAMKDIRLELYTRIISLPIPFFEKHRIGELQSRLTSDVTQLQDVLSFTLAEFFRQIITLLVGVGVIFVTSTQLTLVMLASFPPIIIGAIIFGRFIRKLSKKAQDELANANIVAEETLQAISAVKSYTNEAYESGRYATSLEKVLANALNAARFRGGFISFIIFGIFGSIVLVMWYGLGLVAENQITIGELVSFLLYTTFIGGAAGGLGDLYGQLQKTIGASERVVEIMDETPEVDISVQKTYARFKGEVQFESVRFSYPTRSDVEVLKGVSLSIAPGEKVALVGKSGAGKSTIAQLLQRFYELNNGLITIDGAKVNELGIQQVRSNIGVVPQEVLLFGGTIAENIAYGKPGASLAEIKEAAIKANAWEFIDQFPEGLQTLVGERGIKLSGGQRQRVAIARAILKNPAILILDEATSALDSGSEKLVQDALDKLMEGRTAIIIAHRLSTIKNVDRIYVLEQGQISEQGSPSELAELPDGIYAKLLKMQQDL
jgi:ATP-binding cassette subfamily B protein